MTFNSSPNMDDGNTATILIPFINGMKNAGADVEYLYTYKLNINPCTGEANCWFVHPGKCYQDDDINLLYPKLREADVWVFSTPLYWDGCNGQMKNLIDRMALPLVRPLIELRDGHTRCVKGKDYKSRKVVIVCSCGFWEMDNFDPLLNYMIAFCKNADFEFAGALLRPHAGIMKSLLESGEVNDILNAAKLAGRQLIDEGKFSLETLSTISRVIQSRDRYIEDYNEYIQGALNEIKQQNVK